MVIRVPTVVHVLQDKTQSITTHHTLMTVLLVELQTVLNAIIMDYAQNVMLDSCQVTATSTILTTTITLALSVPFIATAVNLTTSLTAPTAAKVLNSKMENVNLVLTTVKCAKVVHVSSVSLDS